MLRNNLIMLVGFMIMAVIAIFTTLSVIMPPSYFGGEIIKELSSLLALEEWLTPNGIKKTIKWLIFGSATLIIYLLVDFLLSKHMFYPSRATVYLATFSTNRLGEETLRMDVILYNLPLRTIYNNRAL